MEKSKESDGILVETRHKENSQLKEFKATVNLGKIGLDEVFNFMKKTELYRQCTQIVKKPQL